MIHQEKLLKNNPRALSPCALGLAVVLGGCGKSEFEELTELAEQGDAEAQFKLAHQYNNKNYVEEAVLWMRKAAEQGHAKGWADKFAGRPVKLISEKP